MTGAAPRWPLAVDGAVDGLLVAFAGWTLVYQVALASQLSMTPLGWPLALALVAVSVVLAVRSYHRGDQDGTGDPSSGTKTVAPAESAARRGLPSASQGRALTYRRIRWTVSGTVLVLLLVLRGVLGVWPLALVMILLVAGQLLALRPQLRSADGGTDGRPAVPHVSSALGQGAHLVAVGIGIGLAILGSLLLVPDADDVYYVNRATWVAERGTAALGDTIFSPNQLPSAVDTGIPTASIEAFQGVLAHAFGIPAPSMCYVIFVPVLSFVLGWTTWRLARAWARHHVLWAFVVSVVFLLASGQSVFGNYTIGRIWQGKVVAIVVLLPTVWLILSRAVLGLTRRDALLLVAAGIAFVGLTGTSALIAPLVLAAAALAAWLLRSRSLVLAAACFVAAPLVNAVVQVLWAPHIQGGGDNALPPAAAVFVLAFGTKLPIVAVGLTATVLAVRLTRRTTGCLLGCGVLSSLVIYLPGVPGLVEAATGAGAVAWRLAVVMPVWVLVGLAVDLRWAELGFSPAVRPRSLAVATLGPGAVVILVSALAGTWIWNRPGAQLTTAPAWKVDQAALTDVEAARARDPAPGLWLMPPPQMAVLAVSSVDQFAVLPRAYYISSLDVPTDDKQDRLVLLSLVSGAPADATAVRQALRRLDVSVACVSSAVPAARSVLDQAVKGSLTSVGSMVCHIERRGR